MQRYTESPPGSPLSSHASSEFAEDVKTDDRDQSPDSMVADLDDGHLMPPAKRPKTGQPSFRSTSVTPFDADDSDGDISSDTSGSIPASELGTIDQDHHEQVTVCKWQDCPAGDLGNMDELVKHIHEDHIGQRQKKYICQWMGCNRFGSEHASGYALKAHTRSHTKEKPFVCPLPECDRSFTRSDALAKHLRTVHETDNLKPSDPVPKSHSSHGRSQRLKLKPPKPPGSESNDLPSSPRPNTLEDAKEFAAAHEDDDEDDEDDDATAPNDEASTSPYYVAEYYDLFNNEELAMGPVELMRLLRRQVHWIEEEGRGLAAEVEVSEKKRFEEWQRKELVLWNIMEAELSWAAVNGGDEAVIEAWRDQLPYPMLPITGPTPWYRKAPVVAAAAAATPQAKIEMVAEEKVEKDKVGEWVEGVEKQEQSSQATQVTDG
ncbi:MAG: hypothetical protein L6R37_002687 [Teloschistes peruensis]|nr:MAG: hypothetical protein L6R37_002687 [Teloschistes peruensis]